ncbi:MAG: hypothetical protein M3R32_03230 [Chloroflexota bacterium]|nr:hypothetical protein [Chloroflexota bacterium]
MSRRALFEELAKRPDNICPFLGLASSQTEYHDGFTREHRCYAFGDPVELSVEQQEKVCLGRGYGNCPRYLRGVLVIPTDELEALRRPLPPVAAPPPPVKPPGQAAAGGRGGRGPLVIGLVLLVALAAAAGGFFLWGRAGTAVSPTPTPPASLQQSPSLGVSPSAGPSASQIVATPFPETPPPDPTPQPGDTFIGYEVTVLQGQNPIFEIDDQGNVVRQVTAVYSRFSRAPVDRIVAPNGLLHWRTSAGENSGLSYVHGDSGAFLIRKVYQGADGQLRYIVLPDNET